ncbi:type II toxin-antitoxin system VapC family toxin [Chroococcus sp. FPU101]|uniref:type II toxin-antitoxin system VapC family toxin n=1 Tax=Chroococcus sp. FPU101 TaxID=1974212 RepID=UPI001AA4E23B|nr:type II toxin-antitoxin system VapC family toxin [Chroococcus sp. FPU101]GFE72085.1 virulence-associated protein VapC homolog [Chroococcus sp. FPU101]
MMYIFDTDHLSFVQRNGKEGKQILKRLATLDNPEVAVTIITYEEQVRGRLLFLSKARTIEQQVLAYQGLEQLVINYQSIVIVPFNRIAVLEHQRLRKSYPRLGNMDLKIAAITLTNKAVLLTRNQADFQQISELQIEDWSV